VGLAVVGIAAATPSSKFAALGQAAALSNYIPVLSRLDAAIRTLPGGAEGANPNALAGVLVLLLPVQLGLVWISVAQRYPHANCSSLRFARTPAVLALAVTSLSVILLQSRGAWLGLTLAGACWATLLGKRWHKLLLLILVGGSILGLAGTATLLSGTLPEDQLLSLSSSMDARLEHWHSAVEAIRDAPYTGVGLNAFRGVMTQRYSPLPGKPETGTAHAHNHLLQVAVDLGIPGLIAYVSLWLVLAAMLVRIWRNSPDRHYRMISGSLGAGLLAHFAFGMTDAIPLGSKLGVFFWIALALGTAVYRIEAPRFVFERSTGRPD
jgi:putative inorganic carbon (HCO3(-)) transporter